MNEKRKTLVILTPGFAKDESDSTCLPMQQSFIRALNEHFPDLNVMILAFQYPYISKTYQWQGNTVISFNGRNRGGLSKLFLLRRWNKALRKIHQEHHIVGLLSFWYRECAFVGKMFANKRGIKHYCWMWGQDAKKGNRYVSFARLKSNELIAFSDFLQDEFEKNYSTKPQYVITPGIYEKEFLLNNNQRDIDIIGVGSLVSLKQYTIFIEAIAEVKKQFPLVRAVLIGDGPEKQKLQNLIMSMGLQSNIALAGELPHIEVLHWMQRAKVFLHTSSYEGFGIVCIEALGAGAELISFVKPMHKEIENWHIAKNKEEMIKRAINLLKDPRASYKKVVPYTIEQSVQKIAALFSL